MTDSEKPTKPRTDEDRAIAKHRYALAEAAVSEGEIVASGRRRVNRPRAEKKEAFIDSFVKDLRIGGYHVWFEDIADENKCAWYGDETTNHKLKSLRDTLADEVGRAYVVANEAVPVMAGTWATNLLASDLRGKLGVLADLPLNKVEVEVVLAHLESFGYDIPQRMSIGIARRATILLLNRSKFTSVPGTDDKRSV